MPILKSVKEFFLGKGDDGEINYPAGTLPGERDTLSVIRDLSRLVMNDPKAVDIYMALGNLYRARGDLEKAVQIRESLLVRSELAQTFRARTYLELGHDYRRAGLVDRALNAYLEAERLGAPASQINNNLASLYAAMSEWDKACQYFNLLGNKAAEAHYRVRQAEDIVRQNPDETKKALKYMLHATKIYQASPEAWAGIIASYAAAASWSRAAKALGKALEYVEPNKIFMVFEDLFTKCASSQNGQKPFFEDMAKAFLPVLGKHQMELFPNYYGAFMLKRCDRVEEADVWLNRALVIRPDFWSARLMQVMLSRLQYNLPPQLDTDLDFFAEQAKHVKNIVCTVCGLSREVLFYICPRCYSWHSAAYKISLAE